jgi:subtilisin
VAAGDDGSGNSYEVEATVSDTDGTGSTDTATETESEDTSSGPSASIDGVSEIDSPSPHAEFDVSWASSDDDGNLDTAELTLYDDTDGGTEDSATEDISGEMASGTNTLKAKFDEGSGNDYTAELVVTDSEGNSDSDTASFSES